MALVDIINLPKYYVCKNKETDEMFVCYVNGSCHIPQPPCPAICSRSGHTQYIACGAISGDHTANGAGLCRLSRGKC